MKMLSLADIGDHNRRLRFGDAERLHQIGNPPHRGDGNRFIVRADEKLTAFVELESAIR